ncbi:MAG TPA: riboflavin biosynthesis protein RibF [Dehalococcoidia bacterium]|nr:riboflavin biosynthesis protein RibF [Dehalococcoidia bacterium]
MTVGVFDGVHRGHVYLFSHLLRRARALDLAAGAVTLYPDPVRVLHPNRPFYYLTSLEERIELLRATGIDFVAPLTFTSELAELEPADFVAILYQELGMRMLLMGPDNAFGRHREGSPEVIREIGEEMGFRVEVLPEPLVASERPVHSTAIREALAEGNLRLVEELLGRPYSIRGPVMRGDQLGRKLGFPTANIGVTPDRALPKYGVYATWAYLGESRYASATDIGMRPHFGGDYVSVETYIMDFDADIYGQMLKIELVERISAEEKFETLDQLKAKIAADVAKAREILKA